MLGVRLPYFLTVGTVEPRKNLPALVRAFLSLKRGGRLSPEYALVIVGGRGWRGRQLHTLLAESVTQGVHWLGFIPDEDLAALYAGARAFVFPSLYEGFGIPVAEARACGARAVATDIPELREAGGSSGIYIEPTVVGIQEGMLRAVIASHESDTLECTPSWDEAANEMAQQFLSLI
jgi:glycosyltransferase involved in cell wall biosynthesis